MDNEIIIIIFFAAFFFLLLMTSLIMFVLYYQKKRAFHYAEMQMIETKFQQEMLKSGLAIQEQTFATISREIHDNIGQILSLAKLQLSMASGKVIASDEIHAASDMLTIALGDLRDLSKSLHPERIMNQPLYESIGHELRMYTKSKDITVDFIHDNTDENLTPQQRVIVFRIVQELLNNIEKHAQATVWEIKIDATDTLLNLSIIDNGIGMDNNAKPGIGRISMQERIAMLQGNIYWTSSAGKGTKVALQIPYLPNPIVA